MSGILHAMMGMLPSGGGSGPWTPASLFASSEEGAYYDVSTLTAPDGSSPMMYQTIDGSTTPVTAAGQPVGWVRDLSGNGNHAVAAANDGTRPTLKQDYWGNYFLWFDGVDDALTVPNADMGVDATYAEASDGKIVTLP